MNKLSKLQLAFNFAKKLVQNGTSTDEALNIATQKYDLGVSSFYALKKLLKQAINSPEHQAIIEPISPEYEKGVEIATKYIDALLKTFESGAMLLVKSNVPNITEREVILAVKKAVEDKLQQISIDMDKLLQKSE